MEKGDIYFSLYLASFACLILFVISYYLSELIRDYLSKRRETPEEREERERIEREERGRRTGRVLIRIIARLTGIAGLLLIAFGIGVFAYHCQYWAKNGTWLDTPFWSILYYFDPNILRKLSISWEGIERILIWTLNQSASVVLLLLGIMVAGIAFGIARK